MVWVIAGVALLALAAAAIYLFFIRGRASEFGSVKEVVAALNENGIRCTGTKVSPEEQAEVVGAEFGFCLIEGSTVNIHVYENPDRIEQHVALNVSARKEDPDNKNLFRSGVRGPNWVIDTYSRKISKDIQAALGGRIF